MRRTLSPGIFFFTSAILQRELGERWGCFATSKSEFIGKDNEGSCGFTSQQINPGVCPV